MPIGRELDALYKALMAGEFADHLTRGAVPEPGGMVIGAGSNVLPVGRVGHGADGVRMPREDPHLLAVSIRFPLSGPNEQAGSLPIQGIEGGDQRQCAQAIPGARTRAANGSAASSYHLDNTGALTLITGSAPTHQTAACWTAISPDGRYAYTMNAGSGSVSGYRVRNDGRINLLAPSGISGLTGAGSHPTDAGFTESGRYLYVLSAGTNGITAFRVQGDGSLSAIGGGAGLPTTAVGLVAR